ncbi:DNA starvation/stationary phase protection protein [Natronospirillum operosum]|uniref:DNA starvation/stationary phase protection protein n=1 Tax=Natronospirillum operosum TaxID=2759953 RepID=A0A4Z0WHH8_9GAMM|nr:Dps family protein [Natronospirillum operosum]TGG96018.1 DNA starvation/stationary phase protection protein [Natronospirillum operosum]
MSTNAIGLEKEQAQILARGLNDLLANYQVFYMNTRGYHWNIRGKDFFELHVKFEELYTDLLTKIDEIAERILTLGEQPEHTYSSYLEAAAIKERTHVSDGTEAVSQILEAFRTVIARQRAVLSQAAEADDEGTSALMSDYIREQEKQVWMYSAYLNR